MPRLSIKKKDYLLTDTSKWVRSKLRECNLSQEYIAEQIGCSQQMISQKIRRNAFSQHDLAVIFHETKATDSEILKLMRY